MSYENVVIGKKTNEQIYLNAPNDSSELVAGKFYKRDIKNQEIDLVIYSYYSLDSLKIKLSLLNDSSIRWTQLSKGYFYLPKDIQIKKMSY